MVTDKKMFVKKIDEAKTVIYNIGSFNSKIDIKKYYSSIEKSLKKLSLFDSSLRQLTSGKIYLFNNNESDFNKVFRDIQMKTLNKDKTSIIVGYDGLSTIAGERAFYCKCLKENKIPVLIHLGANVHFYSAKNQKDLDHKNIVSQSLLYGFKEENICILGARVINLEEKNNLVKYKKITCLKTLDLLKLGIEKTIDYIVKKYNNDKYLFYINYDLNLNDPAYVPGSLYPEAFGLNSIEVLALIKGLITMLKVSCISIIGFDPLKDVNSVTSNLLIRSITEIISSFNGK